MRRALVSVWLVSLVCGCSNGDDESVRDGGVETAPDGGDGGGPDAEPDGGRRAGTFIDRDELGTPYIYAASMEDAAFALGYAMATDHGHHMVTRYVGAEGRLAEVLGRGSDDSFVRADATVRALRIPETSRELYPELDSDLRAWIESFAEGVSRWLEENRDDPALASVTGWSPSPETIFAAARTPDILKQLRVATEDIGRWDPTGSLPCPGYVNEDLSEASNVWAVGAPLVAGATAILASDPHLPWDLDPLDGLDDGYFWYEAHFLVDGRRFGGGFPLGEPLQGPGYTDDLAFGGTHSGADIADAFHLVRVGETGYLHGDEERELRSRRIEAAVRGEEPAAFTIFDSDLGPVVCAGGAGDGVCRDPDQEAFAVVLPHLAVLGNLPSRWRVLSAGTVREALEAVSDQGQDEGNTVAADRNGGLVYVLVARIPARDPATCYARAVESTNADALPSFDGEGRLVVAPVADHPTILDPPSGYLVNNNVAPQSTHAGLSGDDLAWHNGLFSPEGGTMGGYRQRRARAFFDAAEPGSVDLDASIELAMNSDVVPWPTFRSILAEIRDELPLDDEEVSAAVAELEGWDGRVRADSAAALIFRGWTGRLDDLDEEEARIAYLSPPEDGLTEPQRSAAIAALSSSAADDDACLPGVAPWLATERGTPLVAWGDVHVLLLPGEDPARARPLGSGDSFLQTLWMSTASQSCPDYGFANDRIPSADRGSSFMLQVAFRPDPEVWVVKPKGDLADPSDPRYGAMSDLFATGQYRLVELNGPGGDAIAIER